MIAESRERWQRQRRRKALFAGLALIGVTVVAVPLVAIFAVIGSLNSVAPYGQERSAATREDAITIAERNAAKMLKYPLDAEFGPDHVVRRESNGQWIVTGRVKAMNGFGAKHTLIWGVKLVPSDLKAQEWKIIKMQLDGDEMFYDAEAERIEWK